MPPGRPPPIVPWLIGIEPPECIMGADPIERIGVDPIDRIGSEPPVRIGADCGATRVPWNDPAPVTGAKGARLPV